MKKNIIILFLICIMILLVSTCSLAAEKPKISVLYFINYLPQSVAVIENRAMEWGEKNGVEVVFNKVVEKDYDLKVASMIESKGDIDICVLRCSFPALYKDALLDVGDVVGELIKRDGEFYPATKEQAYIEGQWVSVPFYTVAQTMYYRKDLLKAAGQKVPETYADLAKVGLAINQPEKGIFGIGTGLSRSMDGQNFVNDVLWSFGSKMTTEDGKTVTFNSPETLAGIKYIIDLYNSGVMPPGVTGWDDSTNNKAWTAGTLGIINNAPSIYWTLKESAPELRENTGFAQFPKGPAGRMVITEGYGFSIFKWTKNPDLAKDLLSYILSEDVLKEFYVASEGFNMPTNSHYLDMPVYSNDPNLKVIVDSLPFGHAFGWPGPVNRAAAEVWAKYILVDIFTRILLDDLTPEEALQEATKKIEDIYAQY